MNVHSKIVFFVQVFQLGSNVHGELRQNVGITLDAFSVKAWLEVMISRGLLVYGGVPYFKFGILLEKFYVIKVEWLSDEK